MQPTTLVVMGASGSGKTTVANLLAEHLDRPLAEADDFHPTEVLHRLAAGQQVSDEDRLPWLETVRDWMDQQAEDGRHSVVSCTALKRAYRDVLRESRSHVRFIFLDGEEEILAARLDERRTETGGELFMPSGSLTEQLAVLEPLDPDEDGITVPVTGIPLETMADALTALGLRPG